MVFTRVSDFMFPPSFSPAVSDAHVPEMLCYGRARPEVRWGGPAWGRGPVAHFTRRPFHEGRHGRRGCHIPRALLREARSMP
ncbi:hypothetical protein SBA5_720015 [Candidatus Sulfotelmatomonas gaucii]|uniref:Uncharacterized protein n=1 Tax=Candidatus Sulfuritelmatomonas gaucii TaxID=2043161 RepID=A0A2N9M2Y1_9BACT|nr:hypothetical protein SBA5_720015 [Candidatus Sulfotelmatomonas gaucii]